MLGTYLGMSVGDAAFQHGGINISHKTRDTVIGSSLVCIITCKRSYLPSPSFLDLFTVSFSSWSIVNRCFDVISICVLNITIHDGCQSMISWQLIVVETRRAC